MRAFGKLCLLAAIARVILMALVMVLIRTLTAAVLITGGMVLRIIVDSGLAVTRRRRRPTKAADARDKHEHGRQRAYQPRTNHGSILLNPRAPSMGIPSPDIRS